MKYWLDIIVVAVIAIYAISCTKKGFVNCLFGFVSTIASFALAFLFSNTLLEGTNGLFGLAEKVGVYFASGLSWLLIFFAVKLMIRIVKKFITAIVEKIPVVGSLNHLLGLAVGLLEGLLIVWIVLAVLGFVATYSAEATKIITEGIEKSFLAKIFYENNPVIGWLSALVERLSK